MATYWLSVGRWLSLSCEGSKDRDEGLPELRLIQLPTQPMVASEPQPAVGRRLVRRSVTEKIKPQVAQGRVSLEMNRE